ncbi:MAG: class I SAM-dependent methyltransferase [Planctomycetota bacterium]
MVRPDELPTGVAFPDEPLDCACPACSARATRAVFRIDSIPIHSCVLLDDAETARKFPRGSMLLAVCTNCGFLFNAAFDPERLDYSEDYEETQGCSPTFNRWLDGVATDLARDVGLDRSTILEVGCGRGDFLALLSETTNSTGIGVDPSRTAGRVTGPGADRLTFLHEPYGERHASTPVDLIACRHTLEHIGDVRTFLEQVAAHAAASEAAVFIEVPEMGRILREGAFWDVYYEHSSYFSTGSLARAIDTAGLRLDRVWTTYADQYVQLIARSKNAPGEGALPPDDLAELLENVETFCTLCVSTLRDWDRLLRSIAERGETVSLWGSGSKATAFLATVAADDVVDCVVDINPMKHGRFVAGTGHEIVPPKHLTEVRPDHVVVMNPIYVDEIRSDLEAMGLSPTLHALGSTPAG